tara:strand:+ start:418 stop:3669 length:3252 start_codon:yes stop_codon:yes gene_type:complete
MKKAFGSKIIESFAKEVSPSDTITDSFNDFVSKQLKYMLSILRPLECVHYTCSGQRSLKLSILKHKLLPPMIIEADSVSRSVLPYECRTRKLTYSGPLYLSLQAEIEHDGKSITRTLHDVYSGRVPIMIFSDLCHIKNKESRYKNLECEYDVGGYFIINGKEKVLITQTGGLINRMMLYQNKKSCGVAVDSEKNERKFKTTLQYINPKKAVTITFPRLRNEIPVVTVIMALNFSVEEIKSVFTQDELHMLHGSFNSLPTDVEEARRRVVIREVYNVGDTEEERLDKALTNMLIPHIELNNTGNKFNNKGCFLLKMLKELLKVASGQRKATDRDSLINQRLHSSYKLLSTLFFQLLINWSESLKKEFNKLLVKYKKPLTEKQIIKVVSSNNCITDGFTFALATGTFNTKSVNKKVLKGVAQQLQRNAYIATLSQLRKVSSSIDPEMNKNPAPRHLNGTHWGRICPAETPEGKSVGIERTLATTAYISLETDPTAIKRVVKQYLLPLNIKNFSKGIDVYVNGVLLGSTTCHERLISTVKKGRRCGQFEKDVSICFFHNTVNINTTSGRLCRPLLIVNEGKLVYQNEDMGWYSLLRRGFIEYVDAEEEQTALVANFPEDITPDHTHLEISNTLMHGINAGSIPFSDRNPAPRNTFQSAMSKQAQGYYTTNYQWRDDTTSNVLYYTQRPLVETHISKVFNVHKAGSGLNCVVAIMPKEGYGQEDSVIFKKSFIERGGFRASHYSVTEQNSVKNTKEKTVFCIPEASKRRKIGNFNKLDHDGIIHTGSKIDKKDCIVGKKFTKTESKKSNNVVYEEDQSEFSSHTGTVESVMVYQGKKGDRGCKIKTRTTQIPKIGDKFSSRHGQKGTIGMIYGEEDMPFTMGGMTPDIIVNPLAIPSRMTIGHVLEMLTGKAIAVSGKEIDGSPFSGLTTEDVGEILHDAGFQKQGNEMMMNGATGEMLKSTIFIGCIFYQRLKHMVDYKFYARRVGKRNMLTRQPNGGRSAAGGLRFGEMEKNTAGAHGAPGFIRDRLVEVSDKHVMWLCPKCKQPALKEGCKRCGNETKRVVVPWAAHLLFQELASMSLKVNLNT